MGCGSQPVEDISDHADNENAERLESVVWEEHHRIVMGFEKENDEYVKPSIEEFENKGQYYPPPANQTYLLKFSNDSAYYMQFPRQVSYIGAYSVNGDSLYYEEPIFSGDNLFDQCDNSFSYSGDTLIITQDFITNRTQYFLVPTLIEEEKINKLCFERVDWSMFHQKWINDYEHLIDIDSLSYIGKGIPRFLDLSIDAYVNYSFSRDTLKYYDPDSDTTYTFQYIQSWLDKAVWVSKGLSIRLIGKSENTEVSYTEIINE